MLDGGSKSLDDWMSLDFLGWVSIFLALGLEVGGLLVWLLLRASPVRV